MVRSTQRAHPNSFDSKHNNLPHPLRVSHHKVAIRRPHAAPFPRSSRSHERPTVPCAQKIGIVIWCFSAAICLFSFVVLRNDLHNREWSYFFLCSGLITSVLLIDDYFLMHEFLTRYSQIAEKVILSVYGIVVALYLIRFSKTLLNTEYLLLLIAFGFFGFSIMIDPELVYFPGGTFAEDGTKLFGIANWCAYHTRACLKQIKLSTIVSAHLGQ